MSDATLNRDVALRIALATREIPDMTIARMLDILQEGINGPLTAKTLKGMSVTKFKTALGESAEEINADDLKRAAAALRGEQEIAALPSPETGEPLHAAVRVAIASTEGELLNGHFGSCVRFLVYDVNVAEIRLVDIRSTLETDAAEDKNAARADLIGDCAVLYMISIGGPAAAKVIRSGIYPIKEKAPLPAREALARFQSVMAGSPPPWLAKILGQAPEARVRFSLEEEVA